jgi:hypothetical protein
MVAGSAPAPGHVGNPATFRNLCQLASLAQPDVRPDFYDRPTTPLRIGRFGDEGSSDHLKERNELINRVHINSDPCTHRRQWCGEVANSLSIYLSGYQFVDIGKRIQ